MLNNSHVSYMMTSQYYELPFTLSFKAEFPFVTLLSLQHINCQLDSTLLPIEHYFLFCVSFDCHNSQIRLM